MTTIDDIRSRTADATTAALLLTALGEPILASTLWTWDTRRKLVQCGKDDQDRRTYLIGDVIDLALARHTTERANREKALLTALAEMCRQQDAPPTPDELDKA